MAGGSSPTRPKRKGKPKIVSQKEIDAMAAENMKDIPSDDDVSVDENDPDLLGELNELTGIKRYLSRFDNCYMHIYYIMIYLS